MTALGTGAEESVYLLMRQRGRVGAGTQGWGRGLGRGGPASSRPSCFSSPRPTPPGVCPGAAVLSTALLHQILMSTNLFMPFHVVLPPEVLLPLGTACLVPYRSLTMPHPNPAGTDFGVAACLSILAPYQCRRCLLCPTAKP